MGLDLDLDQETMTELHREALEEKTDGTGANVSLVPQIREAGDESSDPQYEEVIGDVDVDTGAVTVSDMTELVAGLDFKIDESVYDYKSLGLDGLTILEVKAEVNLRAKNLKSYQEKFSPEISVRTSMADYKKEEWLVNLPLYAIDQITAF